MKISEPNTLKHREKEYKGVAMEKDSPRLLIMVSQKKFPLLLSISPICGEVFSFLMRVLAIKKCKIHLAELDFQTK